MSATVNGKVAVNTRLTLPLTGAWWCDVEMAEDVPLSGRVALIVADMTLSGTVTRSASFAGHSRARIYGGAASWGKTVPKKGYNQASGLVLQQLVSDAARAAGETVGAVPGGSVGTHYSRRKGPASQVFALLGPAVDWWVDDLGVTQFGARTPGQVITAYQAINYDPIAGRVVIATDSLTSFRPGKTIAQGVINSIVWDVRSTELRGEVWVS